MGSAILGKALLYVRPSSFCNVVLPISRVLCYPPPKSPKKHKIGVIGAMGVIGLDRLFTNLTKFPNLPKFSNLPMRHNNTKSA